ELAVSTLDLVERLARLFFLQPALAFNGEDAVFELDLHVVLPDLRKIGLDEVLLFRFLDVDGWRPLSKRKLVAPGGTEWTVAEHAIQACLHAVKLTKRVPSYDVHMTPPWKHLEQRSCRCDRANRRLMAKPTDGLSA